jgi:hypothetical protein
MAGKKAAKIVLLVSLAEIVLAGENGGKAHQDVFADLANAGLVEVANYDESTGLADVRATAAGKAQYEASLPPVFEIESGVEIPKISGRGRSSQSSKYPFDRLEIGQSFFVANSAEMPEAAKSMNSTTSTANRRYSEVIEGEFETNKKGEAVPKRRQLRKFICREYTHPTKGVGAMIWRVALDA